MHKLFSGKYAYGKLFFASFFILFAKKGVTLQQNYKHNKI